MSSHFIQNVPRYADTNTNDCFLNALSSYLIYKGINPGIVLADFLSFMAEKESGYIGLNYINKPLDTVELTERELNTSLEFLHTHTTVPFDEGKAEDTSCLLRDRINVSRYTETDPEKAYRRLKELVNCDIPVIIALDLYYMRYHRYFNKEHILHFAVVTGYDEEAGTIGLFDKYRITANDFDGTIPIKEVKQARNSENPQKNAVQGEFKRPLMNVWTEIWIDPKFSTPKEKLLNIVSESVCRMRRERTILGQPCGLNMLEWFRKDLHEKKQQPFDEKRIYFYKVCYNEAFKYISRGRRRFRLFLNEISPVLGKEPQTDAMDLLELSARNWDICANLFYKLSIVRSVQLFDEIDGKLKLIIDTEARLVDKLELFRKTI